MQHVNLDVLPYLVALLPFAIAALTLRLIRVKLFEASLAAKPATPALTRLYTLVSIVGYTIAALVATYILTGVEAALYAAIAAGVLAAAPLTPLLANAYAYYALVRSGVIAQGEHIEVDSVKGSVHSIGLYATILRTEEGEYIAIPNRVLAERIVSKRPMDRTLVVIGVRLHGVRRTPGEVELDRIVASLRKLLSEFKASIRGLESTIMLERLEGDTATFKIRLYLVSVSAVVLSSLISRIISALSAYQPDVWLETRE